MKKSNTVLFLLLSVSALLLLVYETRFLYVYDSVRALYMDDMREFLFMTDSQVTFWDKIFSIGANKFRPITNLLMYAFHNLVANNDQEFSDTLHITYNCIIICLLFLIVYLSLDTSSFVKKISISFGLVLLIALSRFSYYWYEEIFGLMESLCLLLTFVFFTLLKKDNFTIKKNFVFALITSVVLYFVHERFLVLYFILFFYICWNFFYYNSQKITSRKFLFYLFVLLFVLLLIFVNRYLMLGNRLLDGTGGTDALSTFNIVDFLYNIKQSFAFLFGFNSSATYLSGISFKEIPIIIKVLVCLNFLCFAYMICKLFVLQRGDVTNLGFCISIYLGIVLLLIVSSTTIRVEMRWILVPWSLVIYSFVLFLHKLNLNKLFLLCFVSVLFVENFHCTYWCNIYNFGIREESSNFSVAMSHYKQNIGNVYIINGEQSVLGYDSFNSILKIEKFVYKKIEFVRSLNELPDIYPKDVVLYRVNTSYTDLTKLLMGISYEGKYEDGWCEPRVVVNVNIKKPINNAGLTFYVPPYPTEERILHGIPKINVYVNEINVCSLEVSSSIILKCDLPQNAFKLGSNKLEIKSDFYIIENSGRSSDGRLSFVMTDFNVN